MGTLLSHTHAVTTNHQNFYRTVLVFIVSSAWICKVSGVILGPISFTGPFVAGLSRDGGLALPGRQDKVLLFAGSRSTLRFIMLFWGNCTTGRYDYDGAPLAAGTVREK